MFIETISILGKMWILFVQNYIQIFNMDLDEAYFVY